MLNYLCHNSLGGGLREKKKRKACWPEEKSCWRCSYWYREDQCVVVGHNSGGDAVVIITQRRPVEEKKKIREKLIFFQILASGFSPFNTWNSPLFIKGGIGAYCLYW
jgi:hypothetical protein